MSRFKPGDHVVCAKGGEWEPSCVGPSYNEVCTIERFSDVGNGYLVFYEYPKFRQNGGRYAYDYKWFEPLITDSQLEEELKSIEKSKTIELV